MSTIPDHAQRQILHALMAAYEKHAMGVGSIDWDELSDQMAMAIQEAIGDDRFCIWTDSVRSTMQDSGGIHNK